MSDPTSSDFQRLAAALEENNRLTGNRPRPPSSPPPTGGSPMLSDFGSKLNTAADSMFAVFNKISTGTATTADAIKAADFVLTKFGGTVGNIAGDALTTLGGVVLQVNNTMKQTAQYGITMNGNLGDFNQAVMHGHLTMEEFAEIVAQSSQDLAGLGGGMDKSAKAFTTMLSDVAESDVARDLKAAGMSSRELAEITQISAMNRRGLDITDKKSREEAAAAAVYLATEIDLAAQVTGKSRKQEEEELKKEQSRPDIQAMIMLKGEKFAENLEKTTVGMSESAKRVVGIYATGGPRSKEDVELVTSYGQAAEQLRKVAESIETGDEATMEKSKIDAQAAIVERMRDKSFLTGIVSTEGQIFGGTAAKVFQQELGLEKAVAAKQKEMGEGTTPEQARAAIEEMRAAGISRDKGELPSGEADLGAAASRSINSLDNLGKVIAATTSDGFKKLNDELGNSVKDSLPKFNNFLKEMATPEGTIKKIGDMVDTGKESLKNAAKEATSIPVTTKKRRTGTLGATGKVFEEFDPDGELVELHGKEAVITEQQLKDIANLFSTRTDSNGEKWYTNNQTLTEFAEDSPQGARISEFLRTLQRGMTGPDGVFQHAYSPETISKAAKGLSDIASKDLNTTLKDMGVTGFNGSPATTKKDNEINAALGMKQKMIDATMNQKTFDPLKNMPGMGNALKSWQSTLSSELKEPPKEKTNTKTTTTTEEPLKKPEQQQSDQTTVQSVDKTTMTDVKDELVKLNMSIKELISHTDRVVDGVSRQTKAITNGMSGSRI
jgi:hypothetical protein